VRMVFKFGLIGFRFSGRFSLQKDENGAIFIDRNPVYFSYVLRYLRDGDLLEFPETVEEKEAVLKEFDFFGIEVDFGETMKVNERLELLLFSLFFSYINVV